MRNWGWVGGWGGRQSHSGKSLALLGGQEPCGGAACRTRITSLTDFDLELHCAIPLTYVLSPRRADG